MSMSFIPNKSMMIAFNTWAIDINKGIIDKYLALDGVYHPIRNAIPNISTL